MTYLDMFELRSPELGALRNRNDVVGLLPLAALEQHGPHLPIGTDTIIARAVAVGTAERVSVPVLVTPVLAGGRSWHHLGFPGTVDLREEALTGYLFDYVATLRNLSIHRIALFSSHGGNFEYMRRIAGVIAEEAPECQVIAFDDLDCYVGVMADAAATCGISVSPCDIHAGTLETSQMLYLWGPERVSVPPGLTGYTSAAPGWRETMFEKGIHALSDIGVLGDPSAASAAAGEAICNALAHALAAWIEAEFELH